jgi:hypothetical protein
MTRLIRRVLLGLGLLAALTGCVAPPPQATVQVFTPPVQLAPGTTYRHERLPLQAPRPDQAVLESVVDAALGRAGLRRDDGNARLAVQATASVEAYAYAPVAGPSWMSVGVGGGSWGGGGVGVGFSFPVGGGPAVYPSQRVDVIVRDLSNGQVLFQSQALSNSGAGPALLLEAALRGFPNMPPGMQVVPLPWPAGY